MGIARAGAWVGLILAVAACTVENDASRSLLLDEGCEQISLLGMSPASCSKDDIQSRGFTCTRNGRHVKGVICGGGLKGYTIRYFK